MRSGWSVRAKLFAVVVPPLVVMVILAVAVILPQLTAAADADDDKQRVGVAELSMRLAGQLQLEQGLAVRAVAGGDALDDSLAAQRVATDDARDAFLEAVGDEPGDVAEAARATAASLDALRARADGEQFSFEVVLASYSDAIADLDAETTSLLLATSDAELLRRATAITALVDGKQRLAEAVNRIAARLERETALTERDYSEFENAFEDSTGFYARYSVATDDAGRDALESTLAVTQVGTLALEADKIVEAGLTGGTYAVEADAWWDNSAAVLTAYDELNIDEFDRYFALAEDTASDAQRNALLAAVATIVGALVAASLAVLLGRSIARRLRAVSDSAHTIAVDRLPEVLESLRNPTPEALAGAIPKVESTSSDEIGSLAESFNTVLRISVETSIEHAARRSETLTKLLINLGRRNQALLERQLELIDTLEASEQDPSVLEGLFKLDHMVTRQRRNAESLLVLAGSRMSRSWSTAVLLSEVISGAISEVAEMGRVEVELAPGHDLFVNGAHAVDLSHLLAELIDNATSYSSPTTAVAVRAQRSGRHVRVWVVDTGVGMSDEELIDANHRVADPPDIDELTTDRVGFQVIGRLARRLGATVRLQTNPAGGIAVGIDLPPSVFEPLPTDLPIVAAAEAATLDAVTSAERQSSPLDDPFADDQTLADLSAASELALAEFDDPETAELPDVPALPRRTASVAPPVVTPLFHRAAVVPKAAVEPSPAEPEVTLEIVEHGDIEPSVRSSDTRTGDEAVASAVPQHAELHGLARRTPGAALLGASAAEADLGLFRRLPDGAADDEGGTTEASEPTERSQRLRAFARGVDDARREQPEHQTTSGGDG